MRRTLILSAVCLGLTGPSLSNGALLEREAAARSADDAYYFSAAKAYGNHAADHVHLLRQFVANRRAPADRAAQHLAGVRSNGQSTLWAYAQLSQPAKDDPERAERLSEIQQQYADVFAICDRLEAAFAQGTEGNPVVGRTLDELQSSLSQARANQQELALASGSW
ncbi:MAG TPA: hypothetical protein VMF30_08435 [Pirellulales bacterium]|nr:hypothetical protein [Pirellulales bacterium]